MLIQYIKGQLVSKDENKLIIENNDIGYIVNVPGSFLDEIPPVGNKIKIYTYLEHREDSMTLYGFLNLKQLEAYKKMLSVSGIGPKIALSALSMLSPDEIYRAILYEDIKTLCQINGVGKKSAKRIILEIKDKIKKAVDSSIFDKKPFVDSNSKSQDLNAVTALQALGYTYKEAVSAIKKVDDQIKTTGELDAILKHALKKLDKK